VLSTSTLEGSNNETTPNRQALLIFYETINPIEQLLAKQNYML